MRYNLPEKHEMFISGVVAPTDQDLRLNTSIKNCSYPIRIQPSWSVS